MNLKLSNNHWSKEVQHLYFNKFLPDYHSGRFVVSSETFSNIEILDCLESETSSSRCVARLIGNQLDSKPIRSILVVGAGSGRLGVQIRSLFPKVILLEVDKNLTVIKHLESKHKNDFCRKPMYGVAHKLPFKDNSIDTIICYSVFRYIKNRRESIDEFIRVAKNDGTIMIGEAKERLIIEEVNGFLAEKNIQYQKKTIPTVKLPHLTFFYYLVNRYGKNITITKMIDQETKITNTTVIQTAFKLAGYSLGSIYTVIWEKRI